MSQQSGDGKRKEARKCPGPNPDDQSVGHVTLEVRAI